MQFAILDRLPREMSQTDRIYPRYFLSRVRVSIRPRIFLYGKKPQTTVIQPAAVDRRSVADKQLNLNGRNPFSPRSSVPRDQRENVVAQCGDHGSNPVQEQYFFHFYCLLLTRLRPTVEPHLTVTSLNQSPLHSGHPGSVPNDFPW